MVIKHVNLETVCGITSKIPDTRLPEIAFAEKSTLPAYFQAVKSSLFVS